MNKKEDDRRLFFAKSCFIDMPFGKKKDTSSGIEIDFNHIYENAIKPAILSVNLNAIRSDEEKMGGIIHQSMFARLLSSEYVVADLTTANANVFYELGIRHAAKPFTTILIQGKLHPPPFDIGNNRIIIYDIEKDGKLNSKTIKFLKQQIKDRLKRAPKYKEIDSPIFTHFKDYPPVKLSHQITDVFQEHVQLEEKFKEDLEKALTNKPNNTSRTKELIKIKKKLGDLHATDDNILLRLMLAFRRVEAWDEMVRLCESFSTHLRESYMVKQQEALARNRRNNPGDREEAEKILGSVLNKYGQDPETLGILGRVYKDMYKDAKKQNNITSSTLLDKSIDAYTKGFYSEPSDYYPGVNAITLLLEKGDQESFKQAKELIPLVYFAASRSIGPSSTDYWSLATLLELNCIDDNAEKIDKMLPMVLVEAKESWMPKTTMDNITLLRESLPKYYPSEEKERILMNLDKVIKHLNERYLELKGKE